MAGEMRTTKGTGTMILGLLGVMALGVGAGCSSEGGGGGTKPNPVSWKTDTVSLTASDFWIVADGLTYFGNPNPIDIHSDPGDPTYTTLELVWNERGREMRFFTYFQADATTWSSNEMRTYNGQPEATVDWLFYEGTFFQSPIGATFHGDLDLMNNASDPFRGELHLHGLALSTTLAGSASGTTLGMP
jgi:hypothetical protein